ncbi:melatonin receptor type 1A-like [Oculina patagonica]
MNNSLCRAQLQNSSSTVLQVKDPLYSSLIANIAISGFFCHSTIMLNIATIHALRKTSSLSNPLKTLFLTLAVSDLGVGLLSQPFYIVYLVEKLGCSLRRSVIPIISGIIVNIFVLSSFSSIMALTVDRYTAIERPLQYQNLLTHKRLVIIVVAIIWMFTALFLPCTVFLLPPNIYSVMFDIVISLAFVATTLSSGKIYLTARCHRIQIQAQIQQIAQNDDMINNARLRKSAQTAFWIYIVFWVCYLPNAFISIIRQIYARQSMVLDCLFVSSVTLVFLNSSLNPVIYCWKMRHIRHTIMAILQNLFRRCIGDELVFSTQ